MTGIGSFTIGVSAIGTSPPFDWKTTLLSQYANTQILFTLLEDFNAYIDQTKNLDDWYDNVWNVMTAQGYGLDVWGRIVGVSRVLQVSNGKFLTFEETGNSSVQGGGWDQAIWYNGQGTSENFRLADDAYRTLILAKALANICDGSIPGINNLLMNLFPDNGDTYVVDNEDMTVDYVFTMPLDAVQSAIVFQSGVLPRPNGVKVNIVTP